MSNDIKLFWPVDSRRINQAFGVNPNFYKPFGLPGHEGLDLFAPTNANVYAAADGEVYQAGHPPDHPYGLHIRILHRNGIRTYRTIYAHLASIAVQDGQAVKAGQIIGQANNTGNSFGSHLHFTLKIDGESTPGYPAGFVDPQPYLVDATVIPPPVTPEPRPPRSGLSVFTTSRLNLRATASITANVRAVLAAGETLSILGDATLAQAAIGQNGQWIHVQTANGIMGYVAANFVETAAVGALPSTIVVYPNTILNVRSAPSTGSTILGTVSQGDALTVFGNTAEVEARIGQPNQWLQVQSPDGLKGYVAAGFVHLTGQTAPASNLVLYPTNLLNVRARPVAGSQRITIVTPTDPLTVLGDADEARRNLGQANRWINVQTTSGLIGYASAQFLGLKQLTTAMSGMLDLIVEATMSLMLRKQPCQNSPEVITVPTAAALTILDDNMDVARSKIGQTNQWLFVQTEASQRGWVMAERVTLSVFDD